MVQPKLLKKLALGSLLATTTLGVAFVPMLQAQSRQGGWLRVQRVSGAVTLVTGGRKSAQIGDRLSQVGHGLVTGNRSSASLSVDDGIGSVAVAQNTKVTVQKLSVLSDGARVTVLDVPRGQARLQVRPFTNPNSRLELHTPSGVAAVRGTVFGVSVDEAGQTNVATLEGQVEASARNRTVPVDAGMVSSIHPGEAPTPARALDRELDIQWRTYEWQGDELYVSGHVDAANSLFVNDQEIPISRSGSFDQRVPLGSRNGRARLTVANAVGETRTHTLYPWLLKD